MYVIVESGGKQYKAGKGDEFAVERIPKSPGSKIVLTEVLLAVSGKTVKIGTPYVKGAKVTCELVREFKDDKKIAFFYRRRKSSRRKVGHRQTLSLLKVKDIEVS